MKRLLLLCPVLIVFAFVTFTQAQVANNTALVGTVLDSSGSAVVGAKVTAVEESTGVVYPVRPTHRATIPSSSFHRAPTTSRSSRPALTS